MSNDVAIAHFRELLENGEEQMPPDGLTRLVERLGPLLATQIVVAFGLHVFAHQKDEIALAGPVNEDTVYGIRWLHERSSEDGCRSYLLWCIDHLRTRKTLWPSLWRCATGEEIPAAYVEPCIKR